MEISAESINSVLNPHCSIKYTNGIAKSPQAQLRPLESPSDPVLRRRKSSLPPLIGLPCAVSW